MRQKLYRFATAWLFALALSAAAQEPAISDDDVRALLEDVVSSGRTVGVVVGMLEADGGRRTFAHGSSGRVGLPLDEHSVFEIGSITKVFTGTLLADMARRGEVELDKPVEELLPKDVSVPTRGGAAISLLDLGTHHSGLPRLPPNFDPSDPLAAYADYTVEDLYRSLSEYRLPREPGVSFEYSNYATALLGHAIALRAGTTYERLLTERLLEPLGMTHTAITPTKWMREHAVRGHDAFGEPTSDWDMPALAAAGGLRSDLDDMLSFAAAALAGGDAGLGAAFRDAQRPRRDAGGPMRVGLHWFTFQPRRHTITWHNGGTGGYRSFLGLDLENRRAVVVLTNAGGDGLDDLGLHLLDPEIPVNPPAADLAIAAAYRDGGLLAALRRYFELERSTEGRFRADGDELNDVGYWLITRGEHEDAVTFFRLYVAANPGQPNPLDSLGDGLRAAGRLRDARAAYAEAVALAEARGDPRLSFYRANLASLDRELGGRR